MGGMFREFILEEEKQLNYFFSHLDVEKAEKMVNLFLSCKGKIVFTGVGKSGIIAEKIAKMMVSTGTKAVTLAVEDALHGDIGILEKEDLFVVMSKSGHTEELKSLLSIAKNRVAKVVGWFCNKEAKLKSFCDEVMILPIERELCPFDLAPTISTQVQLIFGDLLAMALMKKKSFSLNDYALNHPGGAIGRSTTLRVSDIMLKGEKIPLCFKEQTLSEILLELTNKRCGCVVIIDEINRVEGVFTDGDLRRAMQSYEARVFEQKMGDLMTREFMHIEEELMASEALKIMQKNPNKRVTMLPVIKESKIKGVILMHDIINAGVV